MPTHSPCFVPFHVVAPAKQAPTSIVMPAISQLSNFAWKWVVTFSAPWLLSIIQFRIMFDQTTPQLMIVAPAITRPQAIGPCSQRISIAGGGGAPARDSARTSLGVGIQIALPIHPPKAPKR